MNNTFDPFEEPRAPARGNRSTVTGRPKGSRFSPKTIFLAVMIALGILFGAIWSLYPDRGGDSYSQNVPIVRAESKPMKVIPEDAGGMDIPHRDSTVFSALRPNEEERPRIENLLADDEDEEPLPRSQLFAGLNTEEEAAEKEQAALVEIKRPERVNPFESAAIKEDAVEEDIPEIAKILAKEKEEQMAAIQKSAEPEVDAAPAPVSKPKPTVKKELNDVVSNVLGDAPKQAEPKAEVKKAAPVSSGSSYVQLASVKTRLAAESEWTKLKSKYGLGSAYRIQQKDLGDKGTFFRIQAGPYPRETAISICTDIKKKSPGGCLVTK